MTLRRFAISSFIAPPKVEAGSEGAVHAEPRASLIQIKSVATANGTQGVVACFSRHDHTRTSNRVWRQVLLFDLL
jgi:hypothetical protein